MSEKNRNKEQLFEEKKGVETVKEQINESYQSGVIEDQLTNNRDIDSYNNKSK